MNIISKVNDLAKTLQKNWNVWDPEKLAKQIVQIEDLVSGCNLPGIERVQRLANTLHFRFVFPIVSEVYEKGATFAGRVNRMANQILNKRTLVSFSRLSETQQKEVIRYARGES